MPTIRAGDLSFCAAAGFILGMLAVDEAWSGYALFGIAFVLLCATLTIGRRFRVLRPIAIIIILASGLGFLYAHMFIAWRTARIDLPKEKNAEFFGIVVDDPKPAGNFLMAPVELSPPYKGTIDVFGSLQAQFHYGDLLWVQGTITPADPEGDELPALFYPQTRVVTGGQGFLPKQWLISFRSFIAGQFQVLLPPDQAALLIAIVTGSTAALSESMRAQMDASGTSYIVGMYGYKIIIICAALATALKDRFSRRWFLVVALAAIAIFVFASGGAISAVRAAVMGAFALVARASGRVFSPRNALTFAALGMALFDPALLIDPAFQLSFLSYLGIYYLGPPINEVFQWTDPGVLGWKDHAMLSLATNLAILPVAMNTFGDFSLTSFISNILIMIPWALVLGCGALMGTVGAVSAHLVFPVVKLTEVLLGYELFVIRSFSRAVIPLPAIFGSGYMIALYYGLLAMAIYYYAAPPTQKDR